jgi:glycosyltransferase involved in cell wall biosynthesis
MTDARPKRILYANNDARFFLSHRLPLARAAANAGYDIHVAAPPSHHTAAIRTAGFTFHPIRLSRSGLGPAGQLVAIASLRTAFTAVRPDLVHNIAMKAVLYGGLAARMSRVPAVVNTLTGLGWLFGEGRAPALARRAASVPFRLSLAHPNSCTIFQNPDDRSVFLDLRLIAPGRAELIRGSGVSLDDFQVTGEPPGPPLVILPSRMLWSKGIREFVDMARVLRAQGVTARFALVGAPDEGNPTSVTVDQLRAWQQEGIVEWWGHRTDMGAVFAQSHVVCLPSYREGTPKVLIEAAAAGRPIVTTDVPGCREIVRDGDNGYLVPARAHEGLAEATRRLIDGPELRRRMGERGRAICAEAFTIEHVVGRTLALYERLIGSSGSR